MNRYSGTCKPAKYVQSKSAGVASFSVAGDIQLRNIKKMAEDIERIEKILEGVAQM